MNDVHHVTRDHKCVTTWRHFLSRSERRHGSINKPASSYPSSATLPGLPSRARTGGVGGGGPVSAMPLGSSSSSSAGGSNSTHTAKEKLPHRKPHFPPKVLHDDMWVCQNHTASKITVRRKNSLWSMWRNAKRASPGRLYRLPKEADEFRAVLFFLFIRPLAWSVTP